MLAFRPTGDDDYRILGELSVRGVTRQIALTGNIEAPGWNHEQRLSVGLSGQLSRHEFGLEWNESFDEGSVEVGTVQLAIRLSLERRGDWAG